MRRTTVMVGVLLALLLCVAACSPRKQAASGKLRVVTTLFPLYDFARQIGGDRVEVTLLLPPGLEPHSFEPRPEDMVRVAGADLFIYTGEAMEPWVPGLLKGLSGGRRPRVVTASDGLALMKEPEAAGHDHDDGHGHAGGLDPHVWLDFANARKMAATITAGLTQCDPAGREVYAKNAAAYDRQLAALDDRYRRELSSCRTRTFVHGGHYAFGYLARRYDLHYIAATALSSEAEPTPRRLMELTRQVRENGVRHIFYGELVSPRVAETVARETGAALLPLNAAHNVSREEQAQGVTFLTLMERNLDQLRTGLQCR